MGRSFTIWDNVGGGDTNAGVQIALYLTHMHRENKESHHQHFQRCPGQTVPVSSCVLNDFCTVSFLSPYLISPTPLKNSMLRLYPLLTFPPLSTPHVLWCDQSDSNFPLLTLTTILFWSRKHDVWYFTRTWRPWKQTLKRVWKWRVLLFLVVWQILAVTFLEVTVHWENCRLSTKSFKRKINVNTEALPGFDFLLWSSCKWIIYTKKGYKI